MSSDDRTVKCFDTRPCFAKNKRSSGRCTCSILNASYINDGECPFCKPEQFVTDGKFYPPDIYLQICKEAKNRHKKEYMRIKREVEAAAS